MRRFFEYDFLLLLGESSWPASSHSVQKKKVRQDLSHPGTSTLNDQSLVVCLLLPEPALLGHFPDSRTMNEHPHTNPTAFQNHGQSQSATLRPDNKLQGNAITWFIPCTQPTVPLFFLSHTCILMERRQLNTQKVIKEVETILLLSYPRSLSVLIALSLSLRHHRSLLSKKKSSRRIQHTYLTQKSSDKMTKKPFLVNKS